MSFLNFALLMLRGTVQQVTAKKYFTYFVIEITKIIELLY